MRRSLISLCTLALAACAPAGQTVYVAPTPQNVLLHVEPSQSSDAQVISAENLSSVSIWVTSVHLFYCTNVKQACDVHMLHTHVQPGRRAVVFTVEPSDPRQSYEYKYSFSWVIDSAEDAVARRTLAATTAGSQEREHTQLAGAPMRRRASESGLPFVWTADAASFAGRVAGVRMAQDSIVITRGDSVNMMAMRMLLLDASGTPVAETMIGRAMFDGDEVSMSSSGYVIGRHPGRGTALLAVSDSVQSLLGRKFDGIVLPLIVNASPDDNPVTFNGRAVDAATHAPLGCARVMLRDDQYRTIGQQRTDSAGNFSFTSYTAGSFVLQASVANWQIAQSAPITATPGQAWTGDVALSIDSALSNQIPTPTANSSPAAAQIGAPPYGKGTTHIRRAYGTGSSFAPVFFVESDAPAGDVWATFPVSASGRAIANGLVLPVGTNATAAKSIRELLGVMTFRPAVEKDGAQCELVKFKFHFVRH